MNSGILYTVIVLKKMGEEAEGLVSCSGSSCAPVSEAHGSHSLSDVTCKSRSWERFSDMLVYKKLVHSTIGNFALINIKCNTNENVVKVYATMESYPQLRKTSMVQLKSLF